MALRRVVTAAVGVALLSVGVMGTAQAATSSSGAPVGASVAHQAVKHPHSVPGPVRSVRFFDPHAPWAGLGVAWKPAKDAAGYRIVWKDADSGKILPGRPGPAPYTSVIPPFKGSHTFKVSITPFNRWGNGPTAKAKVTVVRRAPVPGPVTITGFTKRAQGTSLEVSWTPAPFARGYRVVWKDADTGQVIPSDRGSSWFTSVIKLKSGTHTYKVSITPFNQAGDGPTAKAKTTATARGALPGPVTGVGFATRGAGSGLEVSWQPAAKADGYRVVWKDADTGEVIPAVKGTSDYSSLITLKSGTHTYKVSITPFNRAGVGPTAKAKTTATGRAQAPGPVTGVEFTQRGADLEVTWRPAANATGYRIVWKDADSGQILPAVKGAGDFSSVIKVKPGNHTYKVSITPFNGSTDGNTVTATKTVAGPTPPPPPPAAVPGPVADVTFSPRTPGQGLEVSWRPAARATGYRIVWKDADTGEIIAADKGTRPDTSVIKVKPGSHSYQVTITPFNAAGDGPTATATAKGVTG